VPATLIAVALVVVATEAGFRAISWRWINATGVEARFNAVLDSSNREALPAARVVVMGSSRPAFGIQARTLAADLGYKSEEGVNLAYPSIYGDLSLELFRRASPLMARTSVLVIGLDDYFLARPRGEPAPAPVVAPASAPQTPRLEISAWKNLQIPDGVRWLGYRIARALGIPVVRATLETWYRSAEGSLLSLGDEDLVLPNPDGRLIADAYFKGKVVDPALMQPYRDLVAQARGRGMKVALVWMPSHPVFDRAVRESYGPIEDETVRAFAELGKETGADFHIFDAASCGLRTADFRDQVHLTPRGAATFTHCLGRYLRSTAAGQR